MSVEKSCESNKYPQLNVHRSGASFLDLPVEIRTQIFRPIAVSPVSQPSTNPHLLPSPLVCDGQFVSIGYFARDTIIPFLLACRIIHDDVSTILYGENVFVFHISGLSAEGWMQYQPGHLQTQDLLQNLGGGIFAERYRPLLRRVFVRTGYPAIGLRRSNYDAHSYSIEMRQRLVDLRAMQSQGKPSQEDVDARMAHELATSAALVRAAWPDERCGIRVNETDVVVSLKCRVGCDGRCGRRDEYAMVYGVDWAELSEKYWPASVGIVWKMVAYVDGESMERKEFRRVV